jgi:hypothetical protein
VNVAILQGFRGDTGYGISLQVSKVLDFLVGKCFVVKLKEIESLRSVPLVARLGLEMWILEENSQDLRGATIDVLDQTKIDFLTVEKSTASQGK